MLSTWRTSSRNSTQTSCSVGPNVHTILKWLVLNLVAADMPEQQANGLYHQGLDDSLDFQQNGLSLSLSDLGAGFGNALADVSDSYDILSPIQNAPFSLADELADAFHPKDNASSGLLAELELETALDDREQDLLSSVQSSPLRNAKSSRATVSSQTRTDDDNYATNAVFEEETRELQESTRSIQGFCSVLQDYNHASARAVGESEGRIEILASNLIRKTYEYADTSSDTRLD